MRYLQRFALPVLVVAIGTAVLIWGVTSIRPVATPPGRVDLESRLDPQVMADASTSDPESVAGGFGLVVRAADVAIQSTRGVTNVGELQSAAEQLLWAYAEKHPVAYQAAMEAQGVIPSELLISNPEAAQELWSIARAFFANASFRTDEFQLVNTSLNGPFTPDGDQAKAAMTGRRDGGRPFLDAPDSSTFAKAELVMPGTFKAQSGEAFDGTFVLQFTLNPIDDLWVATEMRLYGLPNNASIIIPPL